MKKIPVNVISGFLGSGKTTAIIKLLNQKTDREPWAVIINEFGKISIDSQTFRSSTEAGNVFEISGGCICCSAKGYFNENLGKILQEGNYSRIIIEPTGLGGIDMVSEIVKANAGLKLMPIICLVDLTIIENPRLRLISIYRNQILKSDLIVFSKTDLLTDLTEKDRLVATFKSLFPDKHFCFDISDFEQFTSLLNLDFIENPEENKFRMVTYTKQDLTDNGYLEKYYKFEKELILDTESLTLFLNQHPQIIRAKGHINTKKGWFLLNFTLSGCSFEPCQAKEINEIILISEKSDIAQPLNFDSEFASIPNL